MKTYFKNVLFEVIFLFILLSTWNRKISTWIPKISPSIFAITLLNSYPVSDISLYDFKVLFNAEHDTVDRFSLERHSFKVRPDMND